MADESVAALKEIAELLRRRVEQEDAVAARAIEAYSRSAEVGARFQARQEESKQRFEESKHKFESMRGNPENLKADMERRRSEDQEFRKRLLDDLEQHNTLLAQILERLTK